MDKRTLDDPSAPLPLDSAEVMCKLELPIDKTSKHRTGSSVYSKLSDTASGVTMLKTRYEMSLAIDIGRVNKVSSTIQVPRTLLSSYQYHSTTKNPPTYPPNINPK
jgi:hypothetical protein